MNKSHYSLLFIVAALAACSAPTDEEAGGDGDGVSTSTGGMFESASGGTTTSPSGGTGGSSASGGESSSMSGGTSSAGGGVATGGTGGGEPCTPGGDGYTQKAGYVIANATCIHYQVFDEIPERLPFAEATAACDPLTLGGFDDWHLPTVEELSAIVVKGVQPSVDAAVFPNTDLSMYWTNMTNGEKVTCLDFYNDGFQNNAIGPDGPQAYRCVR